MSGCESRNQKDAIGGPVRTVLRTNALTKLSTRTPTDKPTPSLRFVFGYRDDISIVKIAAADISGGPGIQ